MTLVDNFAIASSLLDRPFDSLTCNECPLLKSQTQTVSYEEAALELVGQIELDSDPNAPGQVFRLWRANQLLGTFFEESEGSWVVSAPESEVTGRFSRKEQAQSLLIAIEILNIYERLSEM